MAINLERVLQKLLAAPRITASSLATVSQDQGVYVVWVGDGRPVCLKVGIAGPRRGKGLRERLGLHYMSSPSNSVLARHLAADSESPWAGGSSLANPEQRRVFLSDRCRFQALAVPGISRSELLRLESFVIERLRPVYAGKVKSRTQASRLVPERSNKRLQPTALRGTEKRRG